MSDLKTYVRALCTRGLLALETQKAWLETMPLAGRPDLVRYGEGVGTVGRFYGYTDTIPGFSTYMLYLPEKDAVVLVSVNRLDQDDKSQAAQIFGAVTKILFPQYVRW